MRVSVRSSTCTSSCATCSSPATLAPSCFPNVSSPRERWNTAAIAEAKAAIEKHFVILDRHLADKTWLVAEQLSIADICYAPFLEFLPLMEITPPPAVAAWCERLLTRPSAVATRPAK
jgi:glutathione S-transferase